MISKDGVLYPFRVFDMDDKESRTGLGDLIHGTDYIHVWAQTNKLTGLDMRHWKIVPSETPNIFYADMQTVNDYVTKHLATSEEHSQIVLYYQSINIPERHLVFEPTAYATHIDFTDETRLWLNTNMLDGYELVIAHVYRTQLKKPEVACHLLLNSVRDRLMWKVFWE